MGLTGFRLVKDSKARVIASGRICLSALCYSGANDFMLDTCIIGKSGKLLL